MSFKNKFSNLGHPNQIWTVSAIHGEYGQLVAIHKAIFERFKPGDRLVYTGNYLGSKYARPVETLDEILNFRRALLEQMDIQPDDIVYLRGVQEELWSKLLQIQFAPNPSSVVEWMADKFPDMDSILRGYGSTLEEAARTAREGIINLTRWSCFLKAKIRAKDGHEPFFTNLRRAAFTEHVPARFGVRNDNLESNLLFVHCGLDPALPLAAQEDRFWWASKNFNTLEAYRPFRSVIRGHDPEHGGIHVGKASISLDGGCGHGGKLVCAQLSNRGDVLEILAA
ncbi:MAG: hypothetical protein PW788_15955 [Micavibrio sp.]|nr:hypothetical protein [Micavibrio sp.]